MNGSLGDAISSLFPAMGRMDMLPRDSRQACPAPGGCKDKGCKGCGGVPHEVLEDLRRLVGVVEAVDDVAEGDERLERVLAQLGHDRAAVGVAEAEEAQRVGRLFEERVEDLDAEVHHAVARLHHVHVLPSARPDEAVFRWIVLQSQIGAQCFNTFPERLRTFSGKSEAVR